MQIIKSGGGKEDFSREKLLRFLRATGASAAVAEEIASGIELKAHEGMTTSEIYELAYHGLKSAGSFHPPKYSLKHAVAMLGPTGFPFEQFVARVFEQQGYKVLLDQYLRGECAMHEVDVIAFNEKELIVCEIKFHNELGIKSDLKVALYVKARFDDLLNQPIDILGVPRKMTTGMLITNTKFTLSALEYAMCKGLNLIGWNTPPGKGLEYLITTLNLYPITLLSSLSHVQKQQLIAQGMMLVSDILDKQEIVQKVLQLNPEDTEAVLTEARSLFPTKGL
jgi:hypothetical protein